MWIKVQQQDILIEPRLIYINKINEGSEYCIIGKIMGNSSEENDLILGVYKTLKEVKTVFNDIQSKITRNETLYIMM